MDMLRVYIYCTSIYMYDPPAPTLNWRSLIIRGYSTINQIRKKTQSSVMCGAI